MDYHLTDEQAAIKDMADRFTADEITPHAADWDENHIFPRETIAKAGELGFGFECPELEPALERELRRETARS